jgi:hypothetical protein
MKYALTQDEIVGQELTNVFCDFDAAGLIALRSGAVFSLPGVLMTEVCRDELPRGVAPSINPNFLGATIVDLLRPKDLSKIDDELQESVKLQLSSGISCSLMWWGMGPYLRFYDSAEILGNHQSFWADFDLPNVPDWPGIRKWTCTDVA